ncbi:MAG TPA: DUF2628 domain-containing protein [Beijerinckiaceae bacterium]|jgi:hypothetical protein
MKTYTLHLPADADLADPETLDEARLVRDGFSWTAAIFTFFWFFAQRLWLAGLGVLVTALALGALTRALGASPGAMAATQALFGLLVGLEASTLKRWTLERRGLPVVDVVSAANRDEAEAKSFARLLAGPAPARPVAAAPLPLTPLGGYRTPEPILGLFPEPERRR